MTQLARSWLEMLMQKFETSRLSTRGVELGQPPSLFEPGASGRLTRVVARGIGGTTNVGVNIIGSSPELVDLVAEAGSLVTGEGGNENYAVRILEGGSGFTPVPTLRNVQAFARGGSNRNTGIRSYDSNARLFDVAATGIGGLNAIGLEHSHGHSLIMRGGELNGYADNNSGFGYGAIVHDQQASIFLQEVAIDIGGASGVGINIGPSSFANVESSSIDTKDFVTALPVTVSNGSKLYVNNSSLFAYDVALSNYDSVANIAVSKIDGRVQNEASGTTTCAGVYDANYTFYASTCP